MPLFLLRACAVFSLFLSLETLAQSPVSRHDAENSLRTAIELYERGKYGAAQTLLENYLNDQPAGLQTEEAEYYLALSALQLDHPDAEARLERFADRYPTSGRTAGAWYELGSYYFRRKQYDNAITYLQKADLKGLNADQRQEAQYRLAYALFTKNRFDEAAPLFNSLKGKSGRYGADAAYYAGYLNYRRGNYAEALRDLETAATSETYRNNVPYLIASVYYRQERYEELIAFGEKALQEKTTRNPEEIQLLLGEAHYRRQDYAKAVRYLSEYAAQSRAKLAPDVQYRLAYARYRTGDFAAAAEGFKTIASARDTLGQHAAYYLGASYARTGNKTFALAAFDEARQSAANRELREEAAFQFAKLSYETGRFHEAVEALKAFAQTYPNSAHEEEAGELLSEAYLHSDNYEEAISYVESLRRRTPRLNAAYQRLAFNRGVELFNGDRFSEAVVAFMKSLQYPQDADLATAAHFWIGEAHSVNRHYDDAIAQYSAVFRMPGAASTPYHLKARYGLGYAYYNTKRYAEALPLFQEYVAAGRSAAGLANYDDALLRLADLHYVTKDYAEATRLYDQSIARKGPARDYAYYQKGLVLGLQDRVTEAKSSLDVVISQYPESRYYDDALLAKANLDFERSTYAVAIDGFSRLLSSQPRSGLVPYALLKRAAAYANINDHSRAITDYQRLLSEFATHPTGEQALNGVQESLAQAGRSEEFAGLLSRYKAANPTSGSTENLEFEAAKNLYFTEKYAPAATAFTAFLSSYPQSGLRADANYYLGEAYFRLNNRPGAAAAYRQTIAGSSSFAPRAAARLGEMALAAKNYREAAAGYRQLLGYARSRKDQFTAWLGLLDAYYGLPQADSALYFADQILANGSATPGARNKALLYRGKIAFDRGDYARATDELLKTVNEAQDEYGAEAQYLIGDALYRQKQYKASLEALFRLNESFAEFESWRGRGFLLIAENYVALNEPFQAKATLRSIIDNAQDKALVEQARQRLAKIEAVTPASNPEEGSEGG